jgi:hypothetical protein
MTMDMDLSGIDSPEVLASLIKDLSDSELNQVLGAIGSDQVLGKVFGAMVDRFEPAKAPSATSTQWEIAAPDGAQTWNLVVSGGKAEAGPGPTESPKVTLQMGLPDFLRLVSGSLNGVQAFMAGKIKISGDVMSAASIQSWFRMS